MRVAFVTPRWGPEMIGGAEHALRGFAERLAAAGWECEVLTTRAADHLTWENRLPGGTATEHGVTVTRFDALPSRRETVPDLDARVLLRPAEAWPGEAERWIDLQGPAAPDLLDAVASSSADAVVFSPYLYYPSVRGIPAARAPTVLHPALHDEPISRLSVFERTFDRASAFAFYTEEERELAERRFRVADRPAVVSGIGVDPPPAEASSPEARLPAELEDRPFVLSVGRVEAHKGSALLARSFTLYKALRPGPLALVFAGPVGRPAPPVHDDLVVLGTVDEATKWALLRRARALVSSSPFESFSLVVMEAWSAGTPVLVNAASPVTAGHVDRSRGGLAFADFPSFAAALERLRVDDDVAEGLAAAGRRYVDERYRWPVVIDRYRRFLERVAA